MDGVTCSSGSRKQGLIVEDQFRLSPVVFPGPGGIRRWWIVFVTTALSRKDVDVALGAFEKAGKELALI